MAKRILFTANTNRHLYLCHRPYFKYFNDLGIDVDIASDKDIKLDYTSKSYRLSIWRNPFKLSNIKAIFELKKILDNEYYDVIHTHTPMGAFVTRIAALNTRKRGTKIIYTAHGFHFFKGAPIINYMIYYVIEKILARYTDMLITINKEDYEFAKRHFNTDIRYVPGVGFDEDKFKKKLDSNEIKEFKNKLGLKKEDYVITYVAEISKRKRQTYLLKTISKMNITNEKFLLVGDNYNDKLIKKLIKKYKLENVVKIIEFNKEIEKYLDISDIVISVSKQEGLPLNIMEAMYKKKAIIVTDCRGNRDLIQNNVNGLVVGINDMDALIEGIYYLKNNKDICLKYGERCYLDVSKYSIKNVLPQMKKIYEEVIKND